MKPNKLPGRSAPNPDLPTSSDVQRSFTIEEALPASTPFQAQLSDLVSPSRKGFWQSKVDLQSCFLMETGWSQTV